jgi:acetyltransferase-like isoleucine patch superfamily enzyme
MSQAAIKRSPAESIYAHPQALVESTDIGPGTRIWAFAHVMQGARIGSYCNIGDHAFIESGAIVGNQVTVKNGVAIWGRVTIEDNVFLAPNCVFTNDPNPRSYIKKPMKELTPTLVRENTTIGANATIVCGVTIGRYAFVGAGSVVLRSLPDHALVVGNPSRQIGWMCVCAEKLPLAAGAPIGFCATCSRCRRSFVRTPDGLSNLAAANNSA